MVDDTEVERIALLAEELRIGKRTTIRGKVRVRTTVETVEELAEASLEQETVEVERVPIDEYIDAVPQVRTEGDTTIIPVIEEVLVVEKRLVLKEEIRLHRSRSTENVAVPVALKRERATIERLGTEGSVVPNPEEQDR